MLLLYWFSRHVRLPGRLVFVQNRAKRKAIRRTLDSVYGCCSGSFNRIPLREYGLGKEYQADRESTSTKAVYAP